MEEFSLIQWLLSPIASDRAHHLTHAASWHGRLMVMAWGVLLPVGVLMARFLKITPRQNWPQELDNRTWWYWHLGLQWTGAAVCIVGIFIIVNEVGHISLFETPHHTIGWITIALMIVQILAGLFRGSKGGPTYPASDGSLRGDHYDMTKRRRFFEYTHKTLGYIALICGGLAVFFGLHHANAPIWMWMAICLWWLLLMIVSTLLQRRFGAVDTYQAIWGPDPELPGNKLKPIGFWVKRPVQKEKA